MTLTASVYRLATGEMRPVTGDFAPWRVDDGEHFLAEFPEDCLVELDGHPCATVKGGSRKTCLIDLGNQTLLGARRVEVRRKQQVVRLDIITTGGLRAIERLMPAISEVERWMPRIRGGFWYLDPERRPRRVLDPTRVLAFARDAAPRVADLIRDIERRPATRRTTRIKVRPFAFPLDAEATQKLLCARPELLEPMADGPLHVGGDRYAPRLVTCRIRQADFEADENRRLVAFVVALERDCRTAIDSACWLDATAVAQAWSTARTLRRIVGSSFLAAVPPCDLPSHGDPPVGLEVIHPSYRELRRMRIEYQAKATYGPWSKEHRKHMASADRVYQAWCCYLVAHALDLKETPQGLRASDGLAFTNAEWQLYYDKSGVLQSWRNTTSRPDEFRPDILLRRCSDPSRVIVIDAKYSAADLPQVPGDRLKDVQAYMNSFGLSQAAIMHPGTDRNLRVSEASALGYRIVEIGAIPGALRVDHDLEKFRAAILELECTQGETFPNQAVQD